MSVEKQGVVKSELSPDGGLKLTIKREKTVEDACKPEWVTESRGDGVGKLVIKRRSPASVSQSSKTTGMHVDRQSEQRPILRLSITSSASGDGSHHAQVKSWSLCEAVEDVASASELSPVCQLQPSPKDSGIDISSPPHDDGAVSVESNSGTGIWSATDSHTGDSSAGEVEKMTGGLEKLETTVASFVHVNSAVQSNSKALWPYTASRSCESNRPMVQSTLRSQGECSALKSLTSSSQKLVNPLAKSHRVGRYQHMLPVNRIRAESNVARRSSLEESPTYNMVTSRTSLFSRLPRVKTKLKLLSNNTYAPVFDHEMESNEQHATAQKSKCLNVEKSSSADVEFKRNRLSCKSFTSDAFENVKVKVCFNDENHKSSLEDDKIQKLPKLKLVVKSEPVCFVSCVEQRLEDASVTAAITQAEENTCRRVRRKRRHREIGKMKATSNNASVDSLHVVNGFNTNHLPSFSVANIRSCHSKCKGLKAKQVVDWELPGKASKLQSSTEQLTGLSPELSDLQQSFEDHCKASADEAGCGELSAGQSSVCDAFSKANTAVQEEAGKSESILIAQTKSSALSAESHSFDKGAIHSSSVDIDMEKYYSEGSNFDSEKCTVLNFLNVNGDDNRVDWQHEEKLSLLSDSVDVVMEEMRTAVQRNFTSDCSITHVDETPIADKPCVMITSDRADDRPNRDTFDDQSEKSQHTCAVFDENSMSVTAERPTAVCTNIVVPLLSSPPLVSDDSVMQITNCTSSGSILLLGNNVSDNNEAQDNNLSLTLKPAVVTEGTLSCVAVHCENDTGMVNNLCPVDLDKPDFQDTECQQDIRQEMVGTKELCQKNFEFVSDQDQKPGDECEQIDSDPAFSLDEPSHSMPLSGPCYSKEHKETAVANSACSNGFLAAYTQFVTKVSVKKKSASCKVVETDNTSESNTGILSKPGCGQKCVRRRPFSSQRRHHIYTEKQTFPENRLSCRDAHSQSNHTVECVSGEEASLLETGSLDDLDCSKRLTFITIDDECSTLCREELLNIVSSDRRLVTLRHRVCELLETMLPELRFPLGLQRDSASVERFVKDITDILSDSEAHVQDIQKCSDPAVTLHHMPDRCLQSLQQQVIRLLSLLLPETDLSGINDDSLDVFLELMTSVNRPLPGTFSFCQLNLQPSQETNPQPFDKLQRQGQPSSLCHADTNIKCEQVDTSVAKTESRMSADTLLNMPSSFLQINTSGPIGDKRSIRRQVKDCLMFLDHDLT